jgi:HAD superfamily hydrolase (TIGR01484 family)
MNQNSPLKNLPTAWQLAPTSLLGSIRGVCLDIDDTLSTDGKLTAQAFSALWKLKEAGLKVVPITGRPAGWCDHIARFWPVDAVVGENGAFTFLLSSSEGSKSPARTTRARLDTPGAIHNTAKRALKLEELRQAILERFPHAQFASDQAYREHDLAIDFCEDVAPWPQTDIDALVELCHARGAHAKISSIHVNTWFGDFDKVKGFEHFLSQSPAMPPKDQWLFIGDSPNDEPMFRHFPHSVGVANLKNFLDRLSHAPTYITDQPSGGGFVEMTERLLHALHLNSTQKGI